jgi:hypothetical protein
MELIHKLNISNEMMMKKHQIIIMQERIKQICTELQNYELVCDFSSRE